MVERVGHVLGQHGRVRAEPDAQELREPVGLLDRLAARERGHDRATPAARRCRSASSSASSQPSASKRSRAGLAQRVLDPVVGVEVREGEAALVAEPALVDLGVVAREDPLDLALARRRADVAADRAEAADGRHVLDLPRPRLEAVLRRGQRADRAELDHVAGERRAVGLVLEGGDHRLRRRARPRRAGRPRRPTREKRVQR